MKKKGENSKFYQLKRLVRVSQLWSIVTLICDKQVISAPRKNKLRNLSLSQQEKLLEQVSKD